jgi:hypothetical protein
MCAQTTGLTDDCLCKFFVLPELPIGTVDVDWSAWLVLATQIREANKLKVLPILPIALSYGVREVRIIRLLNYSTIAIMRNRQGLPDSFVLAVGLFCAGFPRQLGPASACFMKMPPASALESSSYLGV